MFKFHYNNPVLKFRRQELRRKSTDSEKIIWSLVRNYQLGYKFFRQYSVDGYVLDFYCPKIRLGIEIDGGIHKLSKKYDDYRNRYLQAANIKLIHFTTELVINDQPKVLEVIRSSLP